MTTITVIAQHREHVAQLKDYLSGTITRRGGSARIDGEVVPQDVLISHGVLAKDFPVIAINKHPVWQSTLPPEDIIMSWLTWPTSVGEAVKRILLENSRDDLRKALGDPMRELLLMQGIRNAFGLWTGNVALRVSCGAEDIDADDASQIIVDALKSCLAEGESASAVQFEEYSPDDDDRL
jgi:hypothetical protein